MGFIGSFRRKIRLYNFLPSTGKKVVELLFLGFAKIRSFIPKIFHKLILLSVPQLFLLWSLVLY